MYVAKIMLKNYILVRENTGNQINALFLCLQLQLTFLNSQYSKISFKPWK